MIDSQTKSPLDGDEKTLLKQALRKASESIKDLISENALLKQKSPIAIIGMACRFPGGANSPQAFWDLLKEGTDAICEVPESRWSSQSHLSSDPKEPGKMYTAQGGFLQEAVDEFDAHFFGITPNEAKAMDPQHRLLLEVSWEAFENAFITQEKLKFSRTGVYIGISGDDYALNHRHSHNPNNIDAYSITGSTFSTAAGRISYLFGLQGPCMAIDTACSSSLVAIHQAVRSLQNKESDMAIAGGVNLILHPEMHIGFSKLQAISPDGRCKTFDASANGYVRGEGCAIVVLKRLEDAQKDGDCILGLIQGSAINQDGKTNGLAAPNGNAQQAVIREALDNAKLQSNQVDFIEAHGTGTILGDPIEVEALGDTYCKNRSTPLLLGSVKTNIGHLEPVAGMAGLIKILLALEHQQIPKNLHLQKPNPHIPWESLPIQLLNEITPWEKSNHQRTAGLSSFGFSGTNAHLIISEHKKESLVADDVVSPYCILNLSAQNNFALKQLVAQYINLIKKKNDHLIDLCYSASLGRNHWDTRLSIICKTHEDLIQSLEAFLNDVDHPNIIYSEAPSSQPKIAFLFTGQGSQYWSMGSQLYEAEPVFREAFDQCDAIIKKLRNISLRTLLFSSPSEQIHQTQYAQPALFSLEYALCQLWQAWGVKPNFVMGHSVGEYAAACVAGVFSLEDGLRLITKRGELMQSLPSGGGMAAIMCSHELLLPYLNELKDTVEIAAFNGPSQILISGHKVSVEQLCEKLASINIHTQLLNVSHAFHSFLMEEILPSFNTLASDIQYSNPTVTMMPNLYGEETTGACMSADYWTKHIRQPVKFSKGIESLEQKGVNVFLEIGPDPILLGMGKHSFSKNATWIPSLKKTVPEQEQIYRALGHLYTQGINVDWKKVYGPRNPNWISIPNYPFQRKSYWHQTRSLSKSSSNQNVNGPFSLNITSSPMINSDVITADLNIESMPLLQEHVVAGKMVFAAASFISLLIEITQLLANRVNTISALVIQDLTFHQMLTIPQSGSRKIQIGIEKEPQLPRKFKLISAYETGEADYLTHLTGSLDVEPEKPLIISRLSLEDFNQNWDSFPKTILREELYARLLATGINLGPSHQWLNEIRADQNTALAKLSVPSSINEGLNSLNEFILHPGLIDSCFCLFTSLIQTDGNKTFLPFAIKTLIFNPHPLGKMLYAKAQLHPTNSTKKIIGDIELYSEKGDLIIQCIGIEGREANIQELEKAFNVDASDLLYTINWQLDTTSKAAQTLNKQHYIVFTIDQEFDHHLRLSLLQTGSIIHSISLGNYFQHKNDDSFELDPFAAEDIQKLIDSLVQENHEIAGFIYCWGLNEIDSLENNISFACAPLLSLLQKISQLDHLNHRPSLAIVTCGAQSIDVLEPQTISQVAQLSLWGLGKTISLEYPQLRCIKIDLDPAATPLENSQFVISKLAPPPTPYHLTIPSSGSLADLAWQTCERQTPLADEVEIEVQTTGLNFKDVLLALHRVSALGTGLGVECAGKIVSVGPGVTQFAVGQRVLAMVPGSLSRFVCAPVATTAVLPPELTEAAAATIPITFLTAAYALESLAHIKPGERVLIHAGTGGVGQAAIQIAQGAGAEVFATASQGKWQILKDLGVQHIFDSRSTAFEAAIQELTQGQGVDVVLNSLRGEFTDASLRLLPPGGRFLEIGITDLRTPEQIEQIAPGIAYFPIDLMDLYRDQRPILQTLLQELMARFAQQELKPLPYQLYPANAVETAFRTMQQAKHTGKVVIDLQESPVVKGEEEEIIFRAHQSWIPRLEHYPQKNIKPFPIDPHASYIVVGGLGGLGLIMIEDLIKRGASKIFVCGRGSPSAQFEAAIQKLQKGEVRIETAQIDVLNLNDVNQWFQRIMVLAPIKGILFLAGQLQDGMIANLQWPAFKEVLSAKTIGLSNVDQASRESHLDFFIAFSSLTAITGSPGQSNYVAGNSFVDGLMKLRRSLGLPGNSINWGPWKEAGMAQRLSQTQAQRLLDLGISPLETHQALNIFRNLGPESPAQLGAMRIDWLQFLKKFPKASTNPFYQSIVKIQNLASKAFGTSPQQVKLQKQNWDELLLSLPTTQRSKQLLKLLEIAVNQVIGASETESIGLRKPLFDLGLDSLTAVELKNRIETNLQCALNTTLLFDYPTLEALCEYLKTISPHIFNPELAEGQLANSTVLKNNNEELDEMSEEDLELLLASKFKK